MPKAKKKTKKKTPKSRPPIKSKDVPVTQKMLFGVRDELKTDISSVRFEIKSFRSEMDSRFQKVISEIHRVGVLVESQHAENRYVLDGYTSLNDRLEVVEKRTNEIEKS